MSNDLRKWILIVEGQNQAIRLDDVVYQKIEQAFDNILSDFGGESREVPPLILKLESEVQAIIREFIKGNMSWLQRVLRSSSTFEIMVKGSGTTINAEFDLQSKSIVVFFPYAALRLILKNQETFDFVRTAFVNAVTHELVHALQILTKKYSAAHLMKDATPSSQVSDDYLSKPYEIEAYANNIAYDLGKIIQKVPENTQKEFISRLLKNRNLMSKASKYYERYTTIAREETLDTLDGVVRDLLQQRFG